MISRNSETSSPNIFPPTIFIDIIKYRLVCKKYFKCIQSTEQYIHSKTVKSLSVSLRFCCGPRISYLAHWKADKRSQTLLFVQLRKRLNNLDHLNLSFYSRAHVNPAVPAELALLTPLYRSLTLVHNSLPHCLLADLKVVHMLNPRSRIVVAASSSLNHRR